MHIIIPMSGTGERFLKAGYQLPKPLIEVDGKPIIAYVVKMFPGETKFTFICNREHLSTTNLQPLLRQWVPQCQILDIETHKQGPVYSVSQAYQFINADEETIVNYCDFFSYFDYNDFLQRTHNRNAAGAVLSYRGFHPHMLGIDNYAFIQDDRQWLRAIQEKKPFTNNRMSEYASTGTYYFSRGEYITTYFTRLMERNIQLNGEFYVSMVYNLMAEDKLPISIYEVQHMLQWGTPYDLEQYQYWSNLFTQLATTKKNDRTQETLSIGLIPMAGQGSRFKNMGYDKPKPLIEVSGKPMVVQAVNSLPPTGRKIFICLSEHLDKSNIKDILDRNFSDVTFVSLEKISEGQASTCALGIENSQPKCDPEAPLLIGACDNGMLFDQTAFKELIADSQIDAIAFTFRGHPSGARNPQMYGWVIVDNNESRTPKIKSVSVKKPISQTPLHDHAIVGTFYFRSAQTFLKAYERLTYKNIRVNNEFYVDSMIGEMAESGLNCRAFQVDQYICWGTPDDLQTFNYWQSFFHKCDWHIYRIESDQMVDQQDKELKERVNIKLKQPYQ